MRPDPSERESYKITREVSAKPVVFKSGKELRRERRAKERKTS